MVVSEHLFADVNGYDLNISFPNYKELLSKPG